MSIVPPFGPFQLMLEAGSATLALPAGFPTGPVAAEAQAEKPPSDADLLDLIGAELDAVETALTRLDDGSFDSCQVCGSQIGPERLLEEPLLTRCPSHA
jgi:RNA polymerase-binding transcription factor DksA